MIVGVLPCLIARLDNYGVVGDFVAAFSFAKKHKGLMCLYALIIASSVLLPLLYGKYLFLVLFPTALIWIFVRLNKKYIQSSLIHK